MTQGASALLRSGSYGKVIHRGKFHRLTLGKYQKE